MLPTTSAAARSSYVSGAIWGLFAISIWVGWILLTRYGVTTSLSPYDITALRFACAGLLLLPIVVRQGFAVKQVGLPLLGVICFGAGVPYVLIASGALQFAPAAHAGALVPGTMPLWTALLAMIFLHEKIGGIRRIGLMMIPVGIVALRSRCVGRATKGSPHCMQQPLSQSCPPFGTYRSTGSCCLIE